MNCKLSNVGQQLKSWVLWIREFKTWCWCWNCLFPSGGAAASSAGVFSDWRGRGGVRGGWRWWWWRRRRQGRPSAPLQCPEAPHPGGRGFRWKRRGMGGKRPRPHCAELLSCNEKVDVGGASQKTRECFKTINGSLHGQRAQVRLATHWWEKTRPLTHFGSRTTVWATLSVSDSVSRSHLKETQQWDFWPQCASNSITMNSFRHTHTKVTVFSLPVTDVSSYPVCKI